MGVGHVSLLPSAPLPLCRGAPFLLPSSQCLGHLLIQFSAHLALPSPSHQGQNRSLLLPRLPPVPCVFSWPAAVIPMLLASSREFNFSKCRHRPFIKSMLFSQGSQMSQAAERYTPSAARVSKLWDLRVLSTPALGQCLMRSGSVRPRGCSFWAAHRPELGY